MEVCVIFKALLTRLLFAAHGILCIWRASIAVGTSNFWFLMLAEVGLFIETLFTLIARKGKEWKWFCPSVLFFLGCTVPSIWFLELDQLERRLAARPEVQDVCKNATQNVTVTSDSPDALHLHSIGINAALTIENWVLALEQILVFLLIIGRWLLPRGDLTRDELSQLLLVYIGMAADIVELFEVFEEENVMFNPRVVYSVLALFSWSLLQFTIVFTAVKARKSRPGAINIVETVNVDHTISRDGEPYNGQTRPPMWHNVHHRDSVCQHCGAARRPGEEVQKKKRTVCGCCHPDIFAISTTILMQDGPFLAFRLYLIFYEHIITQGLLFFVGKNALVIVLQLYRVIVICTEEEKDDSHGDVKELTDFVTIIKDDNRNTAVAAYENGGMDPEIHETTVPGENGQ
ncbi:PREDICTED: transmembrane protein 26-like [Branchiostoma belcheri]|uniref:Transmembrane protein 26-like n=1 Tax=Branchiostoma belcheri TaxID=7741 RepID=A0A6P4YFP0_BRABE|nr:PREDICTED: transmembrane protein 26-like [Branchiostoma belcheri]